jgi:hypothetical protein
MAAPSAPADTASEFWFNGLRVMVGVDGIALDWGWALRREFIGYEMLLGVQDAPHGITLVLRGGETRPFFAADTRAFLKRASLATSWWTLDVPPHGVPSVLTRGGQPLLEWLRALTHATDGAGGGYRAAEVPVEGMWEAVENPRVDHEQRAAAAIALGGRLDDDGRRRLRVAAAASASPLFRAVAASVLAGADAPSLASVFRRER